MYSMTTIPINLISDTSIFHNPWIAGISIFILIVLFSVWMEIRKVRDEEDEALYQQQLKEKRKLSKRTRLKNKARRIVRKKNKT